jgi:hypothetical protein
MNDNWMTDCLRVYVRVINLLLHSICEIASFTVCCRCFCVSYAAFISCTICTYALVVVVDMLLVYSSRSRFG